MPIDTIATVASPTKREMAMARENNSFSCSVDPFCLGMCYWTDCPGKADVAIQEPHPQHQLDLPLTTNADQPHPTGSIDSGRSALASEVELAKFAEGLIPPNTAKTSWTLNNFQQWMSNRNRCNPANPIRDNIFTCTDPQTLNNTLSKLIAETRKSNGEL